jgi:hypothetical protein
MKAKFIFVREGDAQHAAEGAAVGIIDRRIKKLVIADWSREDEGMKLESSSRAGSKAFLIVGWIISAIPILFMGGIGTAMLIAGQDKVAEGLHKYGYPASFLHIILPLEIGCAVIYAIPKTATLGAVLLTGYLGGAVATHVHASEPQWFFPVIMGVLVWLGLVMRDKRLRELLPFRW